MRKLSVFNGITLDGYFSGADGDLGWAHKEPDDVEHQAFVEEKASSGGTLIFGRVTYEMMASFWPTPMAAKMNPKLAERMNSLPKIVFSRTLENANWVNTTLVKGDLVNEVRSLKSKSGGTLTILGSGRLAAELTEKGLIDEYQFLLNPVALGEGRSMFEGIRKQLALQLMETRVFKNGCVLLVYARTV